MGDDEGESVQVAVRMRVFNAREKAAKASRVVRMEMMEKGSKTFCMNPDTEEEKDFKYDYSFQTHDPNDPSVGEYFDQDGVFQRLGRPVLGYALEGKNTCLFAYGQTGAGKSFSMLGKVGITELEGIIPRTCKEIFKIMDRECSDLVQIKVDIQVIEIYCEQINDLLLERKDWPQNGFKPHLTAKDGYVVDTTKKPCFNYDHIDVAMNFADKNRTVGSHLLNPESSRAHTIYQINYSKVKKNDAGKVLESIQSKLNLVDLAGSERTDSAGTSGQMLKEGNAINLSLTALGSCIKCLSEDKKPNFRDSKLTLLLQGSMTNGKVIMIAAVSPASICYAETMSTLRFADRIKQVKIKAKANVSVDPVAEIKKEMEAMRQRMQAEIDALRAGIDPSSAGQQEVEELRRKLAERDEVMADLQTQQANLEDDGTQRMQRATAISATWAKAFKGMGMASKKSERETDPHLVNLNEDDRLTETLVYPFKAGVTWVGRTNPDNKPQMEFNGLGMVKDHCKIEHVTTGAHPRVFLECTGTGNTLVNGKRLKAGQRVELRHQNRIWLGNNYSFRFVFPGQEECGEGYETDPDYFMAEGETQGTSSGLNHRISDAIKKVQQANIIAKDLDMPFVCAAKIYKNRFTHEDDVVVNVKLGNPVYAEVHWTWSKFEQRVIYMTHMWSEWQASVAKDGENATIPPPPEGVSDPFADDDEQRIGEVDVWLASLANMIELDVDASILTPFGQTEGKVFVQIFPCDRNGGTGPWTNDDPMDPFVDNPEELLGRDIQFKICISQCVLQVNVEGGQGCRYENVYVRYKINMDDEDEPWSQTPPDPSSTFNPKFNYSKVHTMNVDKDALSRLQKGRIIFQVWGKLCDSAKAVKPKVDMGQKRKETEAKVEEMRLEVEAMRTKLATCKECPQCKYDLTQMLQDAKV
eukprot:TRINITY_DN20_c0_g1_i2.p1 TRINITY_DN20_c0_g1~~TRINITY_DN20_c0_g1_i2.p1  ORF type:complete len:922 (-),score=264.68 TRINITY_DN20_c0_g1_i2:162-2927(-)